MMTTRDYANRLIGLGQRCGHHATYGTQEWEALPNDDPCRYAAVVRAAELWRIEGTEEGVKARLAEDHSLVRMSHHLTALDVHEAYTEKQAH